MESLALMIAASVNAGGQAPASAALTSAGVTRSAKRRDAASRTIVLNPVRVKVTEYTPGRRSTIRYCPLSSVVAVRAARR